MPLSKRQPNKITKNCRATATVSAFRGIRRSANLDVRTLARIIKKCQSSTTGISEEIDRTEVKYLQRQFTIRYTEIKHRRWQAIFLVTVIGKFYIRSKTTI